MNDAIHFSTLLIAGEALLQQIQSKQPYLLSTAEQRSAFNTRYQQWCIACQAALPDDLRKYFDRELDPLLPPPDPNEEKVYSYYNNVQFALEIQQKQLFIARRRLWEPISNLPKAVQSTIATVCKLSYTPYTVDTLFVDSGCEQGWYIPHTQRDSGSKVMNTALGWLDGILLYAPAQEASILLKLCEAILANTRLTSKNRERIEQILPILQQATAPNVFVPAPLHPIVQSIAAPLLATNLDDDALLKVCTALSNEIKRRVGRTDIDNTKLMQAAFAKDKPLIRFSSEPNEQYGWQSLFSAVFMTIRNPIAHGKTFSTSRAETIEWLTFLSALFHALERVQP